MNSNLSESSENSESYNKDTMAETTDKSKSF